MKRHELRHAAQWFAAITMGVYLLFIIVAILAAN